MKNITKNQKIEVVMKSPELINSVMLLAALMSDIKADNFIKSTFKIEGQEFELSFTKVKKEPPTIIQPPTTLEDFEKIRSTIFELLSNPYCGSNMKATLKEKLKNTNAKIEELINKNDGKAKVSNTP